MNDLSEVRESLALKFSAWDGYTDLRYVDTNYSYLHTPSFLNLSQRERDQDPYTFEMLRRSFPYNGPKLLEQPIIYPDTGPHKYRFDWLHHNKTSHLLKLLLIKNSDCKLVSLKNPLLLHRDHCPFETIEPANVSYYQNQNPIH